jgi:hypothetical protein
LTVEASCDDYWTAIGFEPDDPDDVVVESIAVSAGGVAVTGPAGRWGCCGERDPEVAVFQGLPNTAARDEWSKEFGPVLDAPGALKEYCR